ncbi:MAG TPA: hypothetical protein VKV40_20900 [Ktedonobacteraceae bacterium]|nr:hypothetical protein [Ktedonobacteraceae bacterium]
MNLVESRSQWRSALPRRLADSRLASDESGQAGCAVQPRTRPAHSQTFAQRLRRCATNTAGSPTGSKAGNDFLARHPL